MTNTNTLDLEFARGQFPGLDRGWTLFDNAGGSQTLAGVVARIGEFLLERDVQIGGTYAVSIAAAEALAAGREAARVLVNAERAEEIVFGGTVTLLMQHLARAMRRQLAEGDEIVVTVVDHESNIGPWLTLAEFGITIRRWMPNAVTGGLVASDLAPLLNARTRLVCMTHASNILGEINPVAEIATMVHEVGARLCVDGTAFAPHRAIDVQALDVDYYAFSLYKVYGPHHSILFGRYEHLLELDSLYHYFYGRDKVPGKLEPGNPNYELSYSVTAIIDYLCDLGERAGGSRSDGNRALIERAFDPIRLHEDRLVERLLDWLETRADCQVVGPTANHDSNRVPTIAFKVDGHDSGEIARAMEPYGIAIRFGDFHSRRLIEHLDLARDGGVVRVSLVHYNTLEEVDRFIAALSQTLAPG